MKSVSVVLIIAALIIGMVGYGGCNVPDPYADYIKIYDWTDLDNIRNKLEAKYVLMNNLDSSTANYTELASPTANGGKGWEPIGTWDRASRFYGTLDGQGYEIRDLFIARPDDDYVGLFGIVGSRSDHTPVIRNVGVVNADVSGGDYRVGALIGDNRGSVLSCYSTGSVSGGHYVGGLVGLNDGGGKIVTAAAIIDDFNSAAAIIDDFNSADAIIDNSYSAASVSGYGSCIGGLLGANSGALSRSYSTGNVVGQTSVGGLVGCNAGGLSSGGIVSKCYSTGDVTGQTSVGGLVGTNSARYSYGGIVSQCYSTGNVVGNSPVGGLVGENNNGNVSNSFWDTETSGQATSDGGMGKNTAEMQDITTFSYASWYIGAVANPNTRNPYYTWNIVDGETYPFFRWEPVS